MNTPLCQDAPCFSYRGSENPFNRLPTPRVRDHVREDRGENVYDDDF